MGIKMQSSKIIPLSFLFLYLSAELKLSSYLFNIVCDNQKTFLVRVMATIKQRLIIMTHTI